MGYGFKSIFKGVKSGITGIVEKPIQGASQLDEFEEGDKVEALYKGKGTKWFSGVVKRVNRDGTYEIRYDDGDNEVIYKTGCTSFQSLFRIFSR